MDYLVPTAMELPPIETVHLEYPSPRNPLGLKGIGEGGAISPPAAIANAVEDALAPFGVRVTRTPLGPSVVLGLLEQAARGSREARRRSTTWRRRAPPTPSRRSAAAGDDAKILAGGQSLIPMLALRLARPSALVDINRLRRARRASARPGGILEIGALVRQRALERWAAAALAALRRGAPCGGASADPQSRHRRGQPRPRRSRLRAARAAPLPRRAWSWRGGHGGERMIPADRFYLRAAHHRARRPTSWPPRCASRCRRPARAGASPRSRAATATSRWWARWRCSRARRRRHGGARAAGLLRRGRHAGPGRGGGAGARRPRADAGRCIGEAARGRGGGALARRRHPRHRPRYRRQVAATLAERTLTAALARCGGPSMNEAIRVTVNGQEHERSGGGARDPGRFPARRSRSHRHPRRLRARRVRRLHGAARRRAGARLPHAGGAGRRPRGARPSRGSRPPTRLHPIQEAFWAKHGLQCGYCTPGIIMSACAFLRERPAPIARGDPRDAGRAPLPLHRLPLHRRGHRGGRQALAPPPHPARHRRARICSRASPSLTLLALCFGGRRPRPRPELARGERRGAATGRTRWSGSSAKAFTAKTGIPVEFEVGGTIDRLAKARVAKGSPLVDITFTTSHVGRLYISDGLFRRSTWPSCPTPRRSRKEAMRSEYHIGGWRYVYTIVYRPDLVKEEITKWSDLWKPSLKGKIAMPDFDPSHIITIAALMEGGNETTWQKGQERLKGSSRSIVAFYSTDAQSQDLMKTGQAPVQVMLSVNAYHLQEQGIAVKLVQPTDYPGRGGHRHHDRHGGDQEGGRGLPVHQHGPVQGHPDRAGQGAQGRPGERDRRAGARQPRGPAGHLPDPRSGRRRATSSTTRCAPRTCPRGASGSRAISSRSSGVKLLLAPALAVIAVFAAALGRCSSTACWSSCRARSRRAGFTLANFRSVIAPQYLGVIWDTVWLTAATTVLTLVAAYPGGLRARAHRLARACAPRCSC